MTDIITLQSSSGLRIELSPFGAAWMSCQLPLSVPRDVILTCPLEMQSQQRAYIGATVGRYANRIAYGRYECAGVLHQTSTNQDNLHTLHGGADNFSYRYWDVVNRGNDCVTFSLQSTDGDQGFNGNLAVSVTYAVSGNEVRISYVADSDQESVCALTNHAYVNLDGADGSRDARSQRLQVYSDAYVPIDDEGLPLADTKHDAVLASVQGTPFDFRDARPILSTIDTEQEPLSAYDHSWYFGGAGRERLVCRLSAAQRDVELQLYTTQPALHIYSGNFLADEPLAFDNYSGIALEPGCIPNSPNIPMMRGDCRISPKRPYRHTTRYVFDWK